MQPIEEVRLPSGGMPKKKAPVTAFGAGLAAARRARGLTQTELAEAIGSSQRAISSYESATAHPPAPVLTKIASVLGVTTDELLGVKRAGLAKTKIDSPDARRLWKKFQKLLSLPEKDQRAVMRLLNSLAETRVRSRAT